MDERTTYRMKSPAGAQTATYAGGKPADGKPAAVAPQDKAANRFTKLIDEHSIKTAPKTVPEISTLDNRLPSLELPSRSMICRQCMLPMKKRSRTVLSIPWGIFLVIVGGVLMGLYGVATNFYQVPWFLRFALPAAYYIGSLFIGVGVLFFFIRERIWKCSHCGEITKR